VLLARFEPAAQVAEARARPLHQVAGELAPVRIEEASALPVPRDGVAAGFAHEVDERVLLRAPQPRGAQVDRRAEAAVRDDAPADAVARLQHDDARRARVEERARGREARDASADDEDVGLLGSHRSTWTTEDLRP